MTSLNKRLSDLEAKLPPVMDDEPLTIFILPHNDREPFHVHPKNDQVILIPSNQAYWPDGSLVWDSFSERPTSERLDELSDAQWDELRAAEPLHRGKRQNRRFEQATEVAGGRRKKLISRRHGRWPN